MTIKTLTNFPPKGDTDSIFVKLPGRSVKEAFEFGEKFCNAVSALNPPPIQLKLEKVYLGALLQTVRDHIVFAHIIKVFVYLTMLKLLIICRRKDTVA